MKELTDFLDKHGVEYTIDGEPVFVPGDLEIEEPRANPSPRVFCGSTGVLRESQDRRQCVRIERITITETAEGGRTEFSTYQAQDHGEGKIEDSLPEGFWDRGVMFPMKDVGTQIEIRRLNEDHGEGEG